jgi:hypothetical protein
MRKRVISAATPEIAAPPAADWLPLGELADVEITSERSGHPIEGALLGGDAAGWKADAPGQQTVRLLFKNPQRVKRIWLSFVEPDVERTQEYVLRWSKDHGRSFQEIVRQQWNFSPRGATTEIEDHRVQLDGVTVLELGIVPDTRGGNAVASLARLRLA